MNTNPLLVPYTLAAFDDLTPQQVDEAITLVLAENQLALTALLEDQAGSPSCGVLVKSLEDHYQRLQSVTAPFVQLAVVAGLPHLADACQARQAEINQYLIGLTQNAALQQLLEALATGPLATSYDAPSSRALALLRRNGRFAGTHLSAADQQRLLEVNGALAMQMQFFELNVMEAEQAWSRLLTDEAELAGIVPADLDRMARAARLAGQDGWLLTLDFPTFISILTHATSRDLREAMYRAYTTQASDQGDQAYEFDNGPVISQILRLRLEKANLLGFASYAHLSLEKRGFESPAHALSFMEGLLVDIRPLALIELHTLAEFARESGVDDFQPWDLEFYTERYRQQHFDLRGQDVSEYFTLDGVLLGIGKIIDRLFTVQMTETAAQVWDSSVKVYRFAEGATTLGYLYVDAFTRAGKRPHVWMEGMRDRHRYRDDSLQLPVAVIGCNLNRPQAGQPCLLRLEDVALLLHEFGHALHHLLTTVDHASVAGLRGLDEDAVELPGVLFEKWCQSAPGLALLSAHHKTGEPLPEQWQTNIAQAKAFQATNALLDQLIFSLFDMDLHLSTDADQDAQRTLDAVLDNASVLRPPMQARLAATFLHLFSNENYAAGYYTYVWSAVLATDAYERFVQEGLLNAATGASWRQEVLANGGTRPMLELLTRFRGRQPTSAALLRFLGKAPSS